MARPLVIVGFMGAGKTALGRRLAEQRGIPHADTDALLEAELGRPIAEVFAADGEGAFREAERALVLRELASGGDRVLSLGGGAPADPQIAAALAEHAVLVLDVPADVAWERVSGSGRPLAQDRAGFDALHTERAAIYRALGGAVLAPGALDLAADLDASLQTFAAAGPGMRMTWAAAASGSYPVFIGPGALGIAPGVPGRTIVVTDEAVAPLHLGALAEPAGVVEIPPGEEHKTLATTERIWQALVEQQVTRGDHLLALGGGVVGDLAGYAAACFQRGIPIVQAPTTVVSQVDSAYGGKTGVDLPLAKNYVGAYHQPAAVLADTSTLATLPPEEHAAGYAEVVKTALIAGDWLWARVAAGDPVDDEIIFGCARTKLVVVAEDERDGGRRQVLNLGHTVGHALEVVLGFGTLRHGEAVGLGMLAALRLSSQDALRATVAGLLEAHGLPVTLAGHAVDPDALLAAVHRDKKRVGDGATPFVLVRAPGDVTHGTAVPDADVIAAVRELLA